MPSPLLPPEVQSFWSVDQLASPYDQYEQKADNVFNSGILQVPVAGPPGTPCELIQVCAPYGQRTLSFAAARTGVKPHVPSPDPQDTNQTLLSSNLVTFPSNVDADGRTFLFQAAGAYVYSLSTPVYPTAGLSMGTTPTDSSTRDTFGPQQFDLGLQ